MSMGLLLQTIIDWLPTQDNEFREKINFGVEFRGNPPPTAGAWYIAFDDGGVVQRGRPEDHWINEEYSIIVGLWRRQSEIPLDKLGNAYLESDQYRPQVKTLDAMERQTIGLFHQNWEFLEALNAELATRAAAVRGDNFNRVFIYQGRTGNDTVTLPGEHANRSQDTFIGRRLRFKGIERCQYITNLR